MEESCQYEGFIVDEGVGVLGCEEVEEGVWVDGSGCVSELDPIVAGVGVAWWSDVLMF